jgi:hypothetical protein
MQDCLLLRHRVRPGSGYNLPSQTDKVIAVHARAISSVCLQVNLLPNLDKDGIKRIHQHAKEVSAYEIYMDTGVVQGRRKPHLNCRPPEKIREAIRQRTPLEASMDGFVLFRS